MADPVIDADSIEARISKDCPQDVQDVLRAAWHHDTAALKPLLRDLGKASYRDPVTDETPLHAAIRATKSVGTRNGAGNAEAGSADPAAVETVRQLFLAGAIWNDVDDHNETPGCVAWRLGQPALYDLCMSAGVRAELLFSVLDGYEKLSSDGYEEEEEETVETAEEVEAEEAKEVEAKAEAADRQVTTGTATAEEEPYLASHLTLADGKLVDAAGNGVMMAWETDIMRRSVEALLGQADTDGQGKRVLNIGFGLGIIDSMLAARHPARHHIIEAHPEVLARIDRGGDGAGDHAAAFGAAWEASGAAPGAFCVHRGRWQDLCPALLAQGELYDAIYFDTFGEDYAELHRFFSDYIPGLLNDDGVFGFFNGLGADRRICYDVYTRVVEMHLNEAGLDVEWDEVDVPLAADGLDTPGKGAWEGIVRPYWTLDKYRLPTCKFMG